MFTAGFAGDQSWTSRFALVYGARSYFSAMLGLAVDSSRARRRVGSGMVFAGLLVTMISRCVHFVVGRPVFQLHALPAGMWGRLFGALCIGTGPGVMSTGT